MREERTAENLGRGGEAEKKPISSGPRPRFSRNSGQNGMNTPMVRNAAA